MSSRGSKAINGHVTMNEYETVEITQTGVKILKGKGNKHSLPDYVHTIGAVYAKMKRDGKSLLEMRFYDNSGNPSIEIAYHPEPVINNGKRENVVHYHLFDKNLNRYYVARVQDHPEIKEKYAEYLKEFDLYDKC